MIRWLARYLKRIDIFGVGVELREPKPLLTSRPRQVAANDSEAITVEVLYQLLTEDERIQRLLRNPNWRPAAEAALAYFVKGTACADEGWRQTGTWKQVRAACIDLIVGLLGRYHQRATYGALAGIVGGIAQSVMSDRPIEPANSWIVLSGPPYHPSGYLPEQMAPELSERDEVLTTSKELRDWLCDPN